MDVIIISHAKQRMSTYGIGEDFVKKSVRKPDSIAKGKFGRMVAQKSLNGYMLRIIYEQQRSVITVITIYKAKKRRYEV